MCLSEPLTSLALGRSPYDAVFQGTGADNSRGPRQAYDERGRPINPTTRRINRSIIRSHNEVMHVIGVAEPDGPSPEAEAEAADARRHVEFENYVGKSLALLSDVLVTAGVWGFNGMRQRILIYKEYSHVPFSRLCHLQRSRQSISSSLWSGMPSFLASIALELQPSHHVPSLLDRFREPVLTYLRVHFEIFTFLQRVGLASSTAFFPHWKFFLPGSSLSPIFIPARPPTLSALSIVQWLGACAMGTGPFAAYYVFSQISEVVAIDISRRVLKFLPRTPAVDIVVDDWRSPFQYPPDHPTRITLTDNSLPTSRRDAEDPPRTGYDSPRPDLLLDHPHDAQSEEARTTPSRRQSAVSIRGDDFASDEEEEEGVSSTFISFDVEPTTTPDPSAAVWSAELRQNVAEGAGTEDQEPTYRDSALIRLMPLLAADILGATISRIFLAPHEAQIWLGLARGFARRQGLPLDGFHELGYRQRGVLRMMVNVVGLELVFFVLRTQIWGIVGLFGRAGLFDEEEWRKVSREEDKESKDEA